MDRQRCRTWPGQRVLMLEELLQILVAPDLLQVNLVMFGDVEQGLWVFGGLELLFKARAQVAGPVRGRWQEPQLLVPMVPEGPPEGLV